MIGGYQRWDDGGYRSTTIVTVAELEAEGKEFPVSGDATTRWIGGYGPCERVGNRKLVAGWTRTQEFFAPGTIAHGSRPLPLRA